MPTLVVSPNPAPPSTLVAVAGSGFANGKTRLLLDGVGATTNIFRPRRDGTFNVGITVSATARTQTLIAQQLSGSTWSAKAQVSIVVQAVGPPPPLPPPPPGQKIVTFPTTGTAAQFLALLADNTIDVIEMAGTYRLPFLFVEANRTRPVAIRPPIGAPPFVFNGSNAGGNPQMHFGDASPAANMRFGPLVFEDFVLAQQGLVQVLNAHHIEVSDVTVRNCRANGTTAGAWQAWGVYLTAAPGIVPADITLNRWTFDGSSKQMSAFQMYGGLRVTAVDWTVAHAYYGIYASATRGPITDFTVDDWQIDDTGAASWGAPNMSVGFSSCGGKFSNIRATNSGVLKNLGSPVMVDGGGNIWG